MLKIYYDRFWETCHNISKSLIFLLPSFLFLVSIVSAEVSFVSQTVKLQCRFALSSPFRLPLRSPRCSPLHSLRHSLHQSSRWSRTVHVSFLSQTVMMPSRFALLSPLRSSLHLPRHLPHWSSRRSRTVCTPFARRSCTVSVWTSFFLFSSLSLHMFFAYSSTLE